LGVFAYGSIHPPRFEGGDFRGRLIADLRNAGVVVAIPLKGKKYQKLSELGLAPGMKVFFPGVNFTCKEKIWLVCTGGLLEAQVSR